MNRNTNCSVRPKLIPYQKRKEISTGCSHRQCKMNMNGTKMTCLLQLPEGVSHLESQVAGHTFEQNNIGMLKDHDDGSILKPAGKILCGAREIKFYEEVETSMDPTIQFLRELIPEYRGTKKIIVNKREVQFIKLGDITHGMYEPCVLDIKIGKRTWDPLATPDKIAAEEAKYQDCKQKLGLCIPGFQVYSISGDRVKRYGKDYGKKLNDKTIKEALKIFLNADMGMCRPLLMQLLSGLWSVQKWARTQNKFRIYSSSLLMVYDARRLRHTLTNPKLSRSCSANSNVSLELKSKGSQSSLASSDASPRTPINETIEEFRMVQRTHSVNHNYDQDIKEMRNEYEVMLDKLNGVYDHNKAWAHVKMIDFAHAFHVEPTDSTQCDVNYLFGIENLVKMFEEFLKECE